MIDSAAFPRAAKGAARKTAQPGVLDAAAMRRRQVARLRIGQELIAGLLDRIAELEAAVSAMEKTSVRLAPEAEAQACENVGLEAAVSGMEKTSAGLEPEAEAQACENIGLDATSSKTNSSNRKFFWRQRKLDSEKCAALKCAALKGAASRVRFKINRLFSLLDARLAALGKIADTETAESAPAESGAVKSEPAEGVVVEPEYAETEAVEAELVEAVFIEAEPVGPAPAKTSAGAKAGMELAEVLFEIMPAENPRASAASAISVSTASTLIPNAEQAARLSAIERQLQRELSSLALNLQKQKAR